MTVYSWAEAHDRPGLLVSVRNSTEAAIALAGRADWIDVKDPQRGALAPPAIRDVRSVVATVDGRAPVSVAAGELLAVDREYLRQLARCDIVLVKLGLAGCTVGQQRWRVAARQLGGQIGTVPVCYADWVRAAAPAPAQVLALAVSRQAPAILIDTYIKDGSSLLDCWPMESLTNFVRAVQQAGIPVVLAGSLGPDTLTRVRRLRPELVGVRGAVCLPVRLDPISADLVANVRDLVQQTSHAEIWGADAEFS